MKRTLMLLVAQMSLMMSLSARAEQTYERVITFDKPVRYNGAAILAVTAKEQREKFRESGFRCNSYNADTDHIASQRALTFCKLYMNDPRAVCVSGTYSGYNIGSTPVFNVDTGTTGPLRSNNGNFYCLYFVDAIVDSLTCGVPTSAPSPTPSPSPLPPAPEQAGLEGRPARGLLARAFPEW